MVSKSAINWQTLPGYTWLKNGQSAFSEDLLTLYNQLDRLFVSWAHRLDAHEHLFPTFIAAAELAKLDYFHSFPHLVTFPVTLDQESPALEEFASGKHFNEAGGLQLPALNPVKDVLTPAACYHFYVNKQGCQLDAPMYLTTRATCFRKEIEYLPLQRQWSFSMREIVCIGSAEEVKTFLENFQNHLQDFFSSIGLPIKWENATDPFFKPSKNPKYLLQKLEPVKTEMIFQDSLAIGSINFHRNYFGEAFEISRNQQEAYSGCVAFGLERWIYALLSTFGTDPKAFPSEILQLLSDSSLAGELRVS